MNFNRKSTVKQSVLAALLLAFGGLRGANALSFDLMNAETSMKEGHYREALELFIQAANDSPTDANIRYELADCYKRLSEFGKAKLQLSWVVRTAHDQQLRAKAQALLASMSTKRTNNSTWSSPPVGSAASGTNKLSSDEQAGGLQLAQAPALPMVPSTIPNFITASRNVAANNAPQQPTPSVERHPVVGRPKIIEFYADW